MGVLRALVQARPVGRMSTMNRSCRFPSTQPGTSGRLGRVLIDSRSGVKLGVREGRAAIAVPTPEPAPGTAFPPRRLTLHGLSVFELSLWCGTCPAIFSKVSQPDAGGLGVANAALNAGLTGIDDEVVHAYGKVLPKSTYTVLLLELRPKLINPGGERDYFVQEQVTTWGIDPVIGSAEPAGSPYYRSFEAPVDAERHLYEFVVPMVPPSWNDPDGVARYQQPQAGVLPTAVAYTLLDVLAPAVDEGEDWYWHWLLQHFLIDGHHKVEAAARFEQAVRLLAFVDEAVSMATPEELIRLVGVRASRKPESRRTG